MSRLFSNSSIKTVSEIRNIIPKIKIEINGSPIEVARNITIMQACSLEGIDIPRFCYHEKLSIAGNCRMCLVEVNSNPKLVASCASPVMEGMKIITNNSSVKRGREGVMEFLLANHPLDCPICDQGGECDLQDQSMAFGGDRSRFNLSSYDKRATEDKNIGPIIKTSMNRCIQCTRCVRFAIEVAGINELGTTGRGNDLQISTYIENTALISPLTGNLADLCPVGALLPKPTAFRCRPWELRSTKGIDIMDAMGSSIQIDSRGQEVIRILPLRNEAINEEWATDKVRFSIDSLLLQRLLIPYIEGQRATWSQSIMDVVDILSSIKEGDEIASLIGPFADIESIWAMKKLLLNFGSSAGKMFYGSPSYSKRKRTAVAAPSFIQMNQSFLSFQNDTDTLLLIGTNPEKEAPLLGVKLRKAYLNGSLKNCSYLDVKGIREDYYGAKTFDPLFIDVLKKSKKPTILIGEEYLWSGSGAATNLKMIANIIDEIPNLFLNGRIGISFLLQEASRLAASHIGEALPFKADFLKKVKVLFLIGSYDTKGIRDIIANDCKVIYIGSNAEEGASISNILLPSPAWTEKMGSFLNMEGRCQRSLAAIAPPGEGKEEWRTLKIINDLLPGNRAKISYSDLEGLWEDISKHHIKEASGSLPLRNANDDVRALIKNFLSDIECEQSSSSEILPFDPIPSYYATNILSRLSPTMIKCTLIE